MFWIEDTQKALRYIENNLEENFSAKDLAKYIHSSSSNFQRAFSIITGFSVAEYVRLRRLSLAGQALLEGNAKVIDVAHRYNYETPESFTKAFVKFHNATPSEIKKGGKPLKVFAPLTIDVNVKGGYVMARKLIPNVEKLYEVKTENYMFPCCMRSAMAALSEDKALDFMYFAGVCGDFFVQTWSKDEWGYCVEYSGNHGSATLDPVQLAFDACGYEYEYIPKAEMEKDMTKCIQKIVESIDKGVPILTYGIVGPPNCSIIYGYDENGDTLIGWAQFAENEYFEVKANDGLKESEALIFIGNKKPSVGIEEGIRKSILNIPNFANLPETNIKFGKAAFYAWADSLLHDDDFSNEDKLAQPLDTYGSCTVQFGTNRHYMSDYLNKARALCPDISPIIDKLEQSYKQASTAFDAVTDFQGGFFFENDKTVLLDKDYRVKLSFLIKELGDRYHDFCHSIGNACVL